MLKATRRIPGAAVLLTAAMVGFSLPAPPAAAINLACTAEMVPSSVQAGTADQSFSLTVYNGPQLGVPSKDILPINAVMVHIPSTFLVKGASAPSPWSSVVLSARRVLFHEGSIGAGDGETFTVIADLPATQQVQEWYVGASHDGGETSSQCLPAYPGALDTTVTS